MAADPYTLGIGVELDERVTQTALDRFTSAIQEGASTAAKAIDEAALGFTAFVPEDFDLSAFGFLNDALTLVQNGFSAAGRSVSELVGQIGLFSDPSLALEDFLAEGSFDKAVKAAGSSVRIFKENLDGLGLSAVEVKARIDDLTGSMVQINLLPKEIGKGLEEMISTAPVEDFSESVQEIGPLFGGVVADVQSMMTGVSGVMGSFDLSGEAAPLFGGLADGIDSVNESAASGDPASSFIGSLSSLAEGAVFAKLALKAAMAAGNDLASQADDWSEKTGSHPLVERSQPDDWSEKTGSHPLVERSQPEQIGSLIGEAGSSVGSVLTPGEVEDFEIETLLEELAQARAAAAEVDTFVANSDRAAMAEQIQYLTDVQQNLAAVEEYEAEMAQAQAQAHQDAMRSMMSGLGNFSRSIGDASRGVSGFGGWLSSLGKHQSGFLKLSEELERVSQRVAVTMGGGKDEAEVLGREMISLSESTQFGLDKIMELEQGLSETGHTIGSYSEQTQTALATLHNTFGVGGAEASHMAVSMSGLGGDINGVLTDATAFQKSFGIPGLMKELPGLVEGARKATLEFSESVVGTGTEVVTSTMNMAGTFAKAFGTTIADGLSRATTALNKMRGAAQQDSDVFLGLADGFSGLTMAIMQTGTGLDGAMSIVRDAGKSDLSAIEDLATIHDRMPDGLMKDRFMRQLQKELPEDMLALVKDTNKLHAAMADKKAAEDMEKSFGGKGIMAFNDMGASALDATVELRKMFVNTLELTKAIIGFIGKSIGLPEIFTSLKNRFADLAGRINEFTKSEKFKETLESWKPVIVGVGKVVFAVSAIVGALLLGIGSVLGPVVTGFKSLQATMWVTSKVFPSTASSIAGLRGALGGFGKTALKIAGKAGPIALVVSAAYGVKTAVMDMGAVLGDPNATGVEKFAAVTRGGIKGLASAANTLLLGIPGTILNSLFPEMEDSFDAGFDGLFASISNKFGDMSVSGMIESVVSEIGDWITGFDGWLAQNLPEFNTFAETLGENLTSVSLFLGEVLIKTFSGWYIAEALYDVFYGVGAWILKAFNDIWNGFEKKGLQGLFEALGKIAKPILGIFEKLGGTVQRFFTGVAKSILGKFGVSLKEVGLRVEMAWTSISVGASQTVTGFVNFFKNGWDELRLGFSKFMEFGEVAFVTIGGYATIGAIALHGAFSKAFNGIQIFGLILVKGLTNAFMGMAKDTSKFLADMLRPLAGVVPGFSAIVGGLDKATSKIGALQTGANAILDSQIAAATTANTSVQVQMDLAKSAMEARIAGIHKTRDAEQAGIEDGMAAREKAEDEEVAKDKRKEDSLGRQLQMATAANDQEQRQATEARRLTTASRSQMEQALLALDEEGKKVGAHGETRRDASAELRANMQKDIDAVAEGIAKGEISVRDASDEVTRRIAAHLDTEKRAVADKASQTPGQVADAAGGRTPRQEGVNQAPLQGMWAALRKEAAAAQRPQRVDVNLRGADHVGRAIMRDSAVKNASANGG